MKQTSTVRTFQRTCHSPVGGTAPYDARYYTSAINTRTSAVAMTRQAAPNAASTERSSLVMR